MYNNFSKMELIANINPLGYMLPKGTIVRICKPCRLSDMLLQLPADKRSLRFFLNLQWSSALDSFDGALAAVESAPFNIGKQEFSYDGLVYSLSCSDIYIWHRCWLEVLSLPKIKPSCY
jgi:hypothetical protein